MNSIPKIIHQTWKTDVLPFPYDELSATWKELHPDWEHIIWTDEMNKDFIKDHYPEFLEKYESYPLNIQRADAFRYFVLRKYGGLYVDMDFECVKNFDSLLRGKECVFGFEPDLHASNILRDFLICNAFMAATPDNDFIKFVCEKVMSCEKIKVNGFLDVLNSTGPLILTDAYIDYQLKDKVTILDSTMVYPINYVETSLVLRDKIPPALQAKIDKAYGVHYFFGNWS